MNTVTCITNEHQININTFILLTATKLSAGSSALRSNSER